MQKGGLHIFLAISYQLLAISLFSQTPQTIIYTVKDDLPSNSVYRTVIDHRGFLWVATENGLARFDGKKFRQYTTSDGLTDNEITDLIIDSSNRIWVIPFRRTPCYYNEKTDRFENDETDPELKKIEIGSPHKPHVLQFGGIAFTTNQRKLYIYRDGKTTVIDSVLSFTSWVPVKLVEYSKNKFISFSEDSARYIENGKQQPQKSVLINRKIFNAESEGNKVYLAGAKGIAVYSFDETGAIKLVMEKTYPFDLRIFCKTGKHLSVTSLSGSTYLIDAGTLEIKEELFSLYPVRNVLEDYENNIWLSSMDRGLIKMQVKRISSYDIDALKQNFNAVIKGKYIFVGNNNGEIFRYNGLYGIKKLQFNNEKNIDAWVRCFVPTKYGIYVATQSGSFIINEDNAIIKDFRPFINRSSKTACMLNDSVLLLGNHAMAYQYNIAKDKVVDSIMKRVVSMGADKTGNIYIGSNEGLFLWKEKKLINLGEQRKGFTYRINTIVSSPDNLIWIGLGADSLIVMKDNNSIASIPLGGIIPGNICKSLYSNKTGEIWLGTNKGLNRINYNISKTGFGYNNTYFGVADGLTGEQVNSITINNDTVYVATSSGISYMPANLKLPVSDIATFITGVYINNQAVDVSNSYSLNYSENNITIEFSGVDLTGFIPLFEYSTNESAWQRVDRIDLKNLSPDQYKIKIRALRRDGKPSSKIAELDIKIKTPFWKNPIFWTLLVLFVFGGILYLQQRRNKLKQKAALAKVLTEKRITELEMQALKAQINPHFVFNCLNSIKGFIYDKDYAQADKYLDKFSDLMRSTIDNSDASIISLKDEMAYLDNYLLLEKLRFDEKFTYVINADKNISQEEVYVPAMLLQPYVENAIRHGMRFLENKKGAITITAKLEGIYLVCEIDDNGIGRERASELKSKMHIEYQSRGMNISKRRAELYNIEQEIIDKKDTGGKAAGTKIIIKIPLELKP